MTAQEVTETVRRDLANRALGHVNAAISELTFAELHDEARELQAITPAIAKAAGWTIWAGTEL